MPGKNTVLSRGSVHKLSDAKPPLEDWKLLIYHSVQGAYIVFKLVQLAFGVFSAVITVNYEITIFQKILLS